MFTIAVILSLICLAVPVLTFARMVITGRRTCAEIRSHMGEVRCEYETHRATEEANR